MWICLNDAYLSIVAPKGRARKRHRKDLLVRARAAGDINKAFPEARVQYTPTADYGWRAWIRRERVAEKIAERILLIDYGNFKDSVKENDRHSAYMRIWSNMLNFQEDRMSPSDRKLGRYSFGGLYGGGTVKGRFPTTPTTANFREVEERVLRRNEDPNQGRLNLRGNRRHHNRRFPDDPYTLDESWPD